MLPGILRFISLLNCLKAVFNFGATTIFVTCVFPIMTKSCSLFSAGLKLSNIIFLILDLKGSQGILHFTPT